MSLADLTGETIGESIVDFDDRDVILYALAVGAEHTELDLVYERDLRVLPTFAMPLGLWAVDRLGNRGVFDQRRAVHAAQRLTVRAELPSAGPVAMRAHVANVWDKGSAAVIEVVVESEYFEAAYTVFAPGAGGFGGERGRGMASDDVPDDAPHTVARTWPGQAALYRLTGDRHAIHVDPEAAAAIGAERPILHGLCTLAMAAGSVSRAVRRSPLEITGLEARFSGYVLPGDKIRVRYHHTDAVTGFAAGVGDRAVLSGGRVRFGG